VTRTPIVVVLGGSNGAGKSTTAARLLRGALSVNEFVNADTIAQGLSAYRPESAAIAAGRVMLARLRYLARIREDFAFETTLAGRGHARWLLSLRAAGYRVHLTFLWLPSPDLAVARVAGEFGAAVRRAGAGRSPPVRRRPEKPGYVLS
jgi:predicted ABC-type ATPase